jgi:hypothetical protein
MRSFYPGTSWDREVRLGPVEYKVHKVLRVRKDFKAQKGQEVLG